MSIPVIIAVIFIIAWPILYLVLHFRWPRHFPLGPLDWLLERIPDPVGLLPGILDKLTIPLRYARRPAGEHARLTVDLDAYTGTLPRLETPDRPPWTTAEQPALAEETSR